MELTELASCSGIPLRRLRYAIYHAVMPGVDRVDVGRGSVRSFTDYEAFGIALAAMLFDAGIRRKLVEGCLRLLSESRDRTMPIQEVPLYAAFVSHGPATILIGDGRYVRLRASRHARRGVLDTGWVSPDGSTPPGAFEPVVCLQVNLGPLRGAVKGSAAK